MFSILHNIDGEKTTVLENEAEFVEFIQKIAKENGDEDMFPENVMHPMDYFNQAMDYLVNHCSNLTLL
jgi:hypothetical protein